MPRFHRGTTARRSRRSSTSSRASRAEGGPDYVAPAERIATFDNDGTLWCEQPLPVQGFFLADRVKELAAKDPSMKERQPFKAFLEHDHTTLRSLGKQGLAELFFATHAGMSDERVLRDCERMVRRGQAPEARPAVHRSDLRAAGGAARVLSDNGFKTYIVSGGGIDFMRVISQQLYGIPPEQVIGSSAKLGMEIRDGRPVLMKLAELGTFDDREVKVQNIGLHIGRRPILAFGNSDGDLAMLRYTRTGAGARLALLLHHDDAEREVAYDREFRVSPLVEALDKAKEYGITVVSMKHDWRCVFGTRK